MRKVSTLLLLLLAFPLAAQTDVYVPPVPIGIAQDGKIRKPKQPIAFPSEERRWIRLRSARFDLISSANNERTRDIAGDLDTLASALMRANPRFQPADKPATVFVFESRRESQPYFDLLFARDNARATGAYVRHSGGGTMFIDGSRRGRFERTAMHELIHDLLRQTDVAPPLWLEEGLAEYFSNADVRNGRVTAGEPIREHLSLLQQRGGMSLETMFDITSESEAAASSLFYAQSWAVVDFLMSQNEETFFRFLRDLESGTAVADALRTHYDLSVRDLEASVRRRSGRTVVLKGERTPPPTAEPLDRATLLYELGSFLSHVAGAEEEATRHFREALNVDPKHARTLAATREFERAVAAGPNDPLVHLLYAESLLETAVGPFAGVFTPQEGDVERFRKARKLGQRALELGGEESRARGIIGTSYLVETDLTEGIAQLERSRALDPQRMDYALNLYAMYLRTVQRAKADALFTDAFEHARDKQTIFAARNVLVSTETDRANALAQRGELDEAAAIVRALATVTPDARARAELERQAAQLVSIANVNREIQMYNKAIELTNARKLGEAMKVVEELLATATDADVIRDAKKLRADLRKR